MKVLLIRGRRRSIDGWVEITQAVELDDDDHEDLKDWSWRWEESRDMAKCEIDGCIVRLDRLVCQRAGRKFRKPNHQVRHKDGNQWNCRRANLRPAPPRKPDPKPMRFFYGLRKVGDRWEASLRNRSRRQVIGTYATRDEAAIAYNEAVRESGRLKRKQAELNPV